MLGGGPAGSWGEVVPQGPKAEGLHLVGMGQAGGRQEPARLCTPHPGRPEERPQAQLHHRPPDEEGPRGQPALLPQQRGPAAPGGVGLCPRAPCAAHVAPLQSEGGEAAGWSPHLGGLQGRGGRQLAEAVTGRPQGQACPNLAPHPQHRHQPQRPVPARGVPSSPGDPPHLPSHQVGPQPDLGCARRRGLPQWLLQFLRHRLQHR